MSSVRMTLKGGTNPMSELQPLADVDRPFVSTKRSRALHKKKGNAVANAEGNKTQDSVADPLEKILKRKKIG